jgi:hypothetical protein
MAHTPLGNRRVVARYEAIEQRIGDSCVFVIGILLGARKVRIISTITSNIHSTASSNGLPIGEAAKNIWDQLGKS